jgi:hypothetical protein
VIDEGIAGAIWAAVKLGSASAEQTTTAARSMRFIRITSLV